MARRTKDAPARTAAAPSGRANPKGTAPRGSAPRAGRARGDAAPGSAMTSGRYTAPVPDELRSSPWWVPAIMLGLFGIGVLCIVLNYLSLLPDSPNNWYLLGGLGAIILGFVAATQYH